MKKRILCLSMVIVLVISSFVFVSCANVAPEEGTVTRLTVDINPSIELMVDDENMVVSATALNDDGSILIAGEALVGKTPEEAVELVVSLAAETGYLVQGNVEVSDNTVRISVSGGSKYTEQLQKAVEKKAEAVLEKFDIEGKVERIDALETAALRQLALETGLYSEEQLSGMTDEQLYKVIALGRIETALLLTEDMRNAYYAAREYEIAFAESQATAKIIQGMGGLYNLTYTAYKTALDVYSAVIAELEELRYELLVSPDSEYQKSLAELRDAKVELLKQKTYTASLDINGEEYASASVTLQLSEEQYNKALEAYEALGQRANEAIDKVLERMKQAESKLKELESTIFDEDIEARLTESAAELEAAMNAAKDGFFDKFEAAHAEDIAAVEQALIAKKQQLKESVEGAK